MNIMDANEITPRKFKQLRRSARLTLQEAALLLDTTDLTVWLYERGDEIIPLSAKLIVLGKNMRRGQLAEARSSMGRSLRSSAVRPNGAVRS